ncbi:hypothetical protein I305_01594 [Cryptococcus gattii E566]|uniref:Uncharacterized protein n=2 Tax=Cryptococcus gattii TaxID=37769 RepID=E6R9X2_CRYGW|nr:Hypothetical Protein CGB_G5460W [Cryptococcus gattii WM276]ADV23591.1 Hypothetical Protein CGB_G5460W [Cryptococcus gattii WM276]KIR77712.1 hypothetical protein I306_05448 [Cryptococcus gattii EJB2]KIY36018.1 hypothetical protein I305_01594 [Cryptococcus gattii E566]KJE05516.1 hypothetical protein I311_00722 [Cryptococcus gattii NT-10]
MPLDVSSDGDGDNVSSSGPSFHQTSRITPPRHPTLDQPMYSMCRWSISKFLNPAGWLDSAVVIRAIACRQNSADKLEGRKLQAKIEVVSLVPKRPGPIKHRQTSKGKG